MPSLQLLAAVFFLIAVAQIAHIAVWHIAKPKHYLIWFAIWWLFAPATVLLTSLILLPLFDGTTIDLHKLTFWFAAYAGYIAFAGAYVNLFPAISTSSPSLEILWTLSRFPGQKALVSELRVPTGMGDKMIARRVDNEVINGFLVLENDQLRATQRAAPFVWLVRNFRRILGIDDNVAG